jgi:two-component system CheB/CheR fusion protein
MSDTEQHDSDTREAGLTSSQLDFPVVALGASAGGLSALTTFFELTPPDCGMAFVVVLHLSPDHTSHLAPLLQGVTKMRVVVAAEAVQLQRDHVYVIPPNKLLSLNDGYLRVEEFQKPRGTHITIDLLFRSLAVVHKERAFAVVLSGNGSDGSVGITRIKEEGGVTLVQAPQEAEFDGMPRSAIGTGAVDWVLPVEAMPRKLMDIWANARRIELPQPVPVETAHAVPAESARSAEEALRDVLNLLRLRTGHDFRNYKRPTVLRRLERRLQVHGLPNLPAYRAFMQAQPDEAQALLKDLLIGVTNFFRDEEAFQAIEREALPTVFDQATRSPVGLRAWVAGCSTGEEAYSLAMLLCEQLSRTASPPRVHVFATDIDESAIALGRMGSYPAGIASDMSPARLRNFFDKEGSRYRVRKELREKVMFAVHNILRDPPFSRLDIISCRNLLIYLDREMHAQVLEMFHFALKPGGYLFLGSSESADTASELFSVVDKKHRIFRANVVARSPRYMPMVPISPGSIALSTPLPPLEHRSGKRTSTHAELHLRLAQQYAPPSVLVDENGTIVHLTELAGRFLRHGAGAPSNQLLSLVHPELRPELRTAMFQAFVSGSSVTTRPIPLKDEGDNRYVTMIVRPAREPNSHGKLALVQFDAREEPAGSMPSGATREGADPVVAQLQDELQRTREHLQTTLEQSETSNEELKASNEELQAINEELRSTTEELETSKEELQSINEELITVNHELKAKVEETAKVNDDLQNLIASTDIATVFVDRAMNIKRYTSHATDVFSLIATDVGRSLLDITHKLDYPGLADDAAEAFQALRSIEREVPSRDGRWFLARVLPYRTTEDRIEGAVLTFVDITVRRKAQENLRLVAESAKDYAIIACDTEGVITMWNQGAERIFGWRESEALGQPISLLFVEEDLASGVHQAEMRQALEKGRAEDERWHRRKDGSRFYCSGTTTPLYELGQLRGFGKIARDLTGVKHSEAQREALLKREVAHRAEAQAASELKDEFLAVMSHELKNPLNLIQLNAELLMRMPEVRDLPAVVRSAQTIRKSVLSQAQIIDDLLDMSRMNTGKLTLTRTAMDLVDTVRVIVEALREETRQKDVALQVELPDQPAILDADPVRIEQVVWNLLSNAVKFTPRGGRIDVRLACEQNVARLEVSDTGRGITPEALPHVFEMFKQGEPGTTRRHGGLGIGLALVRSLVLAHGGLVHAESRGLDEGSAFHVCLPLQGRAPLKPDPASRTPQAQLAGLHALVVDDDQQAVDTLRQLLELEGVQVQAASSGAQALQLAQAQRFNFVISDIAMPEMDGHQLVERLKQLPGWGEVPVIALTGMGRPVDARRAIAAGFAAHLKKPLTLQRLLETLRDVVDK